MNNGVTCRSRQRDANRVREVRGSFGFPSPPPEECPKFCVRFAHRGPRLLQTGWRMPPLPFRINSQLIATYHSLSHRIFSKALNNQHSTINRHFQLIPTYSNIFQRILFLRHEFSRMNTNPILNRRCAQMGRSEGVPEKRRQSLPNEPIFRRVKKF
jgi:hypothetical protein